MRAVQSRMNPKYKRWYKSMIHFRWSVTFFFFLRSQSFPMKVQSLFHTIMDLYFLEFTITLQTVGVTLLSFVSFPNFLPRCAMQVLGNIASASAKRINNLLGCYRKSQIQACSFYQRSGWFTTSNIYNNTHDKRSVANQSAVWREYQLFSGGLAFGLFCCLNLMKSWFGQNSKYIKQ